MRVASFLKFLSLYSKMGDCEIIFCVLVASVSQYIIALIFKQIVDLRLYIWHNEKMLILPCFTRAVFFYGGFSMDTLQAYAKAFEQLLPIKYHILIRRNGTSVELYQQHQKQEGPALHAGVLLYL